MAACGGGGGDSRDEPTAGTGNTGTGNTGNTPTTGGASSTAGVSATAGNSASGSGGSGTGACTPLVGKKGDGTTKTIDDIDDANTMFSPAASTAMGSWDFSKDTSMGTITPANTMALMPIDGGQAGKALNVKGTGLTGWGASLAAFLSGATGAFDASAYGGVAFYIKGTSKVGEGENKVMVLARMPDVLPGPGTCCDDKTLGKECYSAHRVVIDITADWKEVKLTWANFAGPAWGLGSTIALDPARSRALHFSFNHDAMTMMPADGASFDVWVDGLRFLATDEMSNVTPGGTGGGGGTGGAGTAGGGAGGAGTAGGGAGGAGTAGGGAGGTAP